MTEINESRIKPQVVKTFYAGIKKTLAFYY